MWKSKALPKIPVNHWAYKLLVPLPLDLLLPVPSLLCPALIQTWNSFPHWFPQESIQNLGRASSLTWEADNLLFISQLPVSSGFLSPPCPSTCLLALQSARPQNLIWFCFSLLRSYFLPFTSCPNSTASLTKSNSHATVPFPKSADRQTKEVHLTEFTLLRRQLWL